MSSTPSSTIHSRLRSGVFVPFRPNVLPAPRWSHCTTVKWSSWTEYFCRSSDCTSPGPPCTMSSTGLVRWLEWIVMYCSNPPSVMYVSSSIRPALDVCGPSLAEHATSREVDSATTHVHLPIGIMRPSRFVVLGRQMGSFPSTSHLAGETTGESAASQIDLARTRTRVAASAGSPGTATHPQPSTQRCAVSCILPALTSGSASHPPARGDDS